MDGLAAVQGRIAAIESRFAPLRPNRVAEPGAGGAVPDFAAVLGRVATEPAGATAPASPNAPLTPAERRAPGQYGKLQPPAELLAYGNGRIPAEALVEIGEGNHRLWAPAARAYQQMVAAARADGVEIGITDSYRDFGSQERLAAQKGLYSQGGLAATPGTSNHGWGVAVDLRLDGPAQAWMSENGWRFGFVEDVPREPWHWTYRPAS